uniref:Uncharacterized protein n=1 Tax=Oryza rufipogon TaxID=4529 RepID=A0A0E0N7E4_ORYRU
MGAGESSNGLTLGMHGIDPRWRRLPWRRRTVQCRARAATSSHDMSTPTPGGRRPDFFLVDGDAPEERMLLTSDGVGGQRHQIVRPTPEEGHATPDVAPGSEMSKQFWQESRKVSLGQSMMINFSKEISRPIPSGSVSSPLHPRNNSSLRECKSTKTMDYPKLNKEEPAAKAAESLPTFGLQLQGGDSFQSQTVNQIEKERESLPTPGEAPPLHFRLYRADPSRGTQGRMVLDSIHRSGRRRSNGRRLQPPSPPRRRWLRSAPRGWTHGIVCAAAALKPPQPIKLSSWASGSHAAYTGEARRTDDRSRGFATPMSTLRYISSN